MSTQERLLINKYSKLLEEVTLENKLLHEALDEAKRQAAMFYENSRRYKEKYNILQEKINLLSNK